MYIELIATHVFFMVLSLVLMPLAIILAATGKQGSMLTAFFGMMSACFGSVAGIVLLLNAPVLSTCVMLTAYDIVMVAIYGLGFGWGDEDHAYLLKNHI